LDKENFYPQAYGQLLSSFYTQFKNLSNFKDEVGYLLNYEYEKINEYGYYISDNISIPIDIPTFKNLVM
jgi:hypothetical protein